MKRGRLRGIAIGGLAVLALAGCARSMDKGMMIESGDVVAERQRLMKLQGASVQDITNKVKAGNIEAVAVNAETLTLTAQHIASLFPKGSITDKSKATPEVWQKWPQFQEAAKNLQVQAERLRDAARNKDAAATQTMANDFAKRTCGQCHTPQADGKLFGPLFRTLL
ncbi:MAG TPA: cytochrome c [Methylomirabilota bacterium]|nr:cytochrome c [Methylomirabilota bacterium]